MCEDNRLLDDQRESSAHVVFLERTYLAGEEHAQVVELVVDHLRAMGRYPIGERCLSQELDLGSVLEDVVW